MKISHSAFVLKRIKKVPKFEIEDAVKQAARVLEIGSFLDRKPRELSGGHKDKG